LVGSTIVLFLTAGAAAVTEWSYVNAQGEAAAVARAHAPGSFADIVQKVAPAVVSIDVTMHFRQQPTVFLAPAPFGDGDDGQVSPPFGFDFKQFFGPGGHPVAPKMPHRAPASSFRPTATS
jgi:S1-C subfamily serine protease